MGSGRDGAPEVVDSCKSRQTVCLGSAEYLHPYASFTVLNFALGHFSLSRLGESCQFKRSRTSARTCGNLARVLAKVLELNGAHDTFIILYVFTHRDGEFFRGELLYFLSEVLV